MLGPVPGGGVEPRPPGAAVWPPALGVGDVLRSGAVSPTARPCPAPACLSRVAGMIRKAPSAARATTTAAKTSLRWADVRSIAAALLPAPQRAQPERAGRRRLAAAAAVARARPRGGRRRLGRGSWLGGRRRP